MSGPLPPLLLRGDCLEQMRRLPDASIDAVVTDPPYGLAELRPDMVAKAVGAWLAGDRDHVPDGRGFMGKRWDRFVPPPAVWDECYRVMKPGAHLVAFAGSRTMDLMGLSVRLAGFEIRDSIAWLYGSGFPKSLDVSKAIDKAAGATREVTGRTVTPFRVDNAATRGTSLEGSINGDFSKQQTDDGYRYTEHTAPATPDAERWQGWGTALKPAFEPIIVARKPLIGTVAANVLEHGTGALNIDATRIGTEGGTKGHDYPKTGLFGIGGKATIEALDGKGRWPANVVLDESQAAELDEQSGTKKPRASGPRRVVKRASGADANGNRSAALGAESRRSGEEVGVDRGDGGGASRFFYVAKAPKSERPFYWRPSCNCETIKPCQSPQKDIGESVSTGGKSSSTSTSGKKRRGGKSRPATTSTTETATSSTMSEATSSSSRSSSTSASIPDASFVTANGGSPVASAVSSSRSPLSTGTSRPKAGRSMGDAAPATLSEWSETSVCANCGAPAKRESHATVKPLGLMRWIARLVTPPAGVILDPFAGSGTTLEAAYLEGFESIGCELEADHWPLIAERIRRATT